MNNPTHETGTLGIWIPRAIWLARGLSLREKALLAELGAHAADADYRPSNQHLIELLDIGERQVRACLAALREKGFITIRLNTQQERIVRVTGKHAQLARRPKRSSGGEGPRPKPAQRRKQKTIS